MATIAEFYSANLGTEAKKGMRQKALSGGTPSLAPLGYLNVGQQIDGKEIRTVIVDPERAPHVRWAFQEYATGNWGMGELVRVLNKRGLRTRATQKRPSKELTKSQLENMLKNPYYTGAVVYGGVEYPGRHEALVDPVTFQQVQAIRESRGKSREKIHQHPQYLKGSLICGYCGNRLGVTNSRGNGGIYPYFYCLGRQNRRTACTFRHVLISTIERKVEDRWANVQLTAVQITALRVWVMSQLDTICKADREEQQRQEQRLARLAKQRAKAKEAYYADAMPLEEFRGEQQRISREEADAKKIIQQHDLEYDELRQAAEDVLALLADAHRLYAEAPSPAMRRMLNQAVFEDFKAYSDEDGSSIRPRLAEPLAALLGSEMAPESTEAPDDPPAYYRRSTIPREAQTPAELDDLAASLLGSTGPVHETNRDPWQGHGSKIDNLAPATGLEPVTCRLTAGRSAD
jgi:site-specific DNA recombinase